MKEKKELEVYINDKLVDSIDICCLNIVFTKIVEENVDRERTDNKVEVKLAVEPTKDILKEISEHLFKYKYSPDLVLIHNRNYSIIVSDYIGEKSWDDVNYIVMSTDITKKLEDNVILALYQTSEQDLVDDLAKNELAEYFVMGDRGFLVASKKIYKYNYLRGVLDRYREDVAYRKADGSSVKAIRSKTRKLGIEIMEEQLYKRDNNIDGKGLYIREKYDNLRKICILYTNYTEKKAAEQQAKLEEKQQKA